jgi:agmatinase
VGGNFLCIGVAGFPECHSDCPTEELDSNYLKLKVDCGDVPGDPWDSAGNQRRATETIRSVINPGAVPIVLGGDDSIPIPVFRVYQDHEPLIVIQIDAHFDCRSYHF